MNDTDVMSSHVNNNVASKVVLRPPPHTPQVAHLLNLLVEANPDPGCGCGGLDEGISPLVFPHHLVKVPLLGQGLRQAEMERDLDMGRRC